MARLTGADAGNPPLRGAKTIHSECREAVLLGHRPISRAIYGMACGLVEQSAGRHKMCLTDYKTLLSFTERWFALGILTDDALHLYGTNYEKGTDKSAEHYRYGAFRHYLKGHRPISEAIAEALYELGASEPDHAMGGAMMADISGLHECPDSITAKALTSDREHLVRVANRRLLLAEMKIPSISPEIFSRGMASQDSVVQRVMIENVTITPAQIQLLAEQGASRAVRNMASIKLKQRKNAT